MLLCKKKKNWSYCKKLEDKGCKKLHGSGIRDRLGIPELKFSSLHLYSFSVPPLCELNAQTIKSGITTTNLISASVFKCFLILKNVVYPIVEVLLVHVMTLNAVGLFVWFLVWEIKDKPEADLCNCISRDF